MKFFIFACCCVLTPYAFAQSNSILIRSVSVLDGKGGPKSAPQDIEILNGKITRIGKDLKSKVGLIIDGTSRIVIPGLIDTHTHIRSVPGNFLRNDSAEAIHRQQIAQKKAYLAVGVTTVLDTASPASLLKEALEPNPFSPRILGLAPFLTPVKGYFSSIESRGTIYPDLWPPVHDHATIKQSIELAAALRPFGTKVTMERGFGPFDTWPIFEKPLREAIVSEAKQHGLPLFIHSMSKEEHQLALSMHPYALVHAGFNDKAADDEIIAEIKNSQAYVSSTLAIYKLMLLMWDPESLSDDWYRSLVPEEQIKSAQKPGAAQKVILEVITQSKPRWLPGGIARLSSPFFISESIVKHQLANAMKSVKMMSDAGIPLVMGSDSGNWPVWSTFFHGVGSILEVEALWEAGLPPMDILVMSTSRAAKMLKIDHEVGSVEVGKKADLIILDEDPLLSKTAYRNPEYVIKDGVAKKPLEWMRSP